jgi:hypothetical protein
LWKCRDDLVRADPAMNSAPGQRDWPVLYAAARSGKCSVTIAPLPPD